LFMPEPFTSCILPDFLMIDFQMVKLICGDPVFL